MKAYETGESQSPTAWAFVVITLLARLETLDLESVGVEIHALSGAGAPPSASHTIASRPAIERHYKYPRTYHLPCSPGITSDDKVLGDTHQFVGREVVITEKLDGESTSVYPKHVHARSLDPRPHPSRDLMKALQAELGYRIPEGWTSTTAPYPGTRPCCVPKT